MGLKSLRSVVFLSIAVTLFFLTAVYAAAIPEPRTQPGGSGAGAIDIIDPAQKPSFLSNAMLVKLTPQARANLKVTGDDVNPAATGIQSLDVICREHGVKSFRSIVTAEAHRDPAAPINSWHKLILAGREQRLTLVEQSNDDGLNLAYSSAEPLGRLMARLKQEPSVESVALE